MSVLPANTQDRQSPLDFTPQEERHWLKKAESLSERFASRAAEYDNQSRLPVENLNQLFEAGFDTALLPREYGGAGISHLTFGKIVSIIARGCPSTACIWLMHAGAATALIIQSPPERAHFYAQELRRGKAFANALSEPASGNRFLEPTQSATPTEGGWILDGAKRFVSGSERADYFLVNVLIDDEPTFFGVPRDESITLTEIWDALGMRATRSQLVEFNNTLLREENRCRPISPTDPNPIGVGLPFLSLGIADATLDALIQHARRRSLPGLGGSVADLQWVQFAVADVHVRLKAAYALAERVLQLADAHDPGVFEASIEAKLLANQVCKDVADVALHVAGGSGFLKPSPIERHFRNAQAPWLMAYSVEVSKDFVGKAVLGVASPKSGGDH